MRGEQLPSVNNSNGMTEHRNNISLTGVSNVYGTTSYRLLPQPTITVTSFGFVCVAIFSRSVSNQSRTPVGDFVSIRRLTRPPLF